MTEYERYQLQWMLDHDHSLTELLSEMLATQQDGSDGDVVDLFNEWEFSHGFGGEIWACEKEWKDCERSADNMEKYPKNIREYVDCTDDDLRRDFEEHIFDNVFNAFISKLPLNPPEIEIDGVSKVREVIWTDGTEILCAYEAMAEKIADLLDAISGEPESHVGYYDPYEDAQSGEVDDHTGFYYVDFD